MKDEFLTLNLTSPLTMFTSLMIFMDDEVTRGSGEAGYFWGYSGCPTGLSFTDSRLKRR